MIKLFLVTCFALLNLTAAGQIRAQTSVQLKDLLGTNLQKLLQLDTRDYLLAINEQLPMITLCKDSGSCPIELFASSIINVKKIKLIEVSRIQIDTGKNKSTWVNLMRVWTKLNRVEEWKIGKSEIQIKLPTTSYCYIGIQKQTGESIRQVYSSPSLSQPTNITIDKKSINHNEVVVTYFESEKNIYIAFYKS